MGEESSGEKNNSRFSFFIDITLKESVYYGDF